jgi:hypothetical protein
MKTTIIPEDRYARRKTIRGVSSAFMLAVQFVERNFPAQCIAMEPQDFRSFSLISTGLFQCGLYEFLFELSGCFFQINSFLDHLGD